MNGGKTNCGFESREVRKKFVPDKDGVTGDWRRLHSEELEDVY